jgi:2-C-methyl-D-erythritol 4-phosphate cytidylyltransferase
MTEKAGAIIVAAGSSTRMGGVDKIFAELCGAPVIARTLRAFQSPTVISGTVLVLAPDSVQRGRDLVAEHGFTRVTVVAGGARRQDSVRSGLEALGECDYVLVHDGPRPFVTAALIDQALKAAQETGAAVPALLVTDTVKEADSDLLVARTLDRSRLWAVQTPQAFRRDVLKRAHREVTDDVTDDAAMVEALGLPVRIFEGSRTNIKITTPDDLTLAAALLTQLSA